MHEKHVHAVCNKAKKTINALRSIVPNCFGSQYKRRMMIFQAVFSIILYGIAAWGDSPALKLKYNLKEVTKTLRPVKRALCMAYRTASANCLDILSGVPPTDLLLEEKYRRSLKTENFQEIHEDIIDEWCDRWRNNPGDSWCKQLISDPEAWLKRKYGYPDFYLTQFFTGHGVFGSYLFRFKRTDSDICKFCVTDRDTPSSFVPDSLRKN